MVSPHIDAYLGNDRYCADLYGARSPCVGVRRSAQLFWHRSFSFNPLSPFGVPYNSHSTICHIITRAEDRFDEDLESLAGPGTRTGCIFPGSIVCFETEKRILSQEPLSLLSSRNEWGARRRPTRAPVFLLPATVKSPRPRRSRKVRHIEWCRRCCLGRRLQGGWP